MRVRAKLFASVTMAGSLAASATAQYVGPTPYLQASDSPLLAAGSFTYYNLENFEDATLAPGLTAIGGSRVLPGAQTDSVDGDDGLLDGSGAAGHAYISVPASSVFEFSFDAGVLGNLPTHAGVVWTDVGITTSGALGISDVLFEAFDATNTSLGLFGTFTLGDGSTFGGTAEDRFFGIANPTGISRIVISMPNSTDWEVDHVQYGYIPTPGAIVFFGVGGLMLARSRRR
jgi:hypothetical protein